MATTASHGERDVLPEALAQLLDGEDLERKEGETLLLLTMSEGGWPHVALLSVGEVWAPDPREVRLALWPGTRTTANLARTRQATLATFVEGTAYYVELDAQPAADLKADGRRLARFHCAVRSVRADVVGYAELLSGVRFRLKDREHVVRWRATIAALREESR